MVDFGTSLKVAKNMNSGSSFSLKLFSSISVMSLLLSFFCAGSLFPTDLLFRGMSGRARLFDSSIEVFLFASGISEVLLSSSFIIVHK